MTSVTGRLVRSLLAFSELLGEGDPRQAGMHPAVRASSSNPHQSSESEPSRVDRGSTGYGAPPTLVHQQRVAHPHTNSTTQARDQSTTSDIATTSSGHAPGLQAEDNQPTPQHQHTHGRPRAERPTHTDAGDDPPATGPFDTQAQPAQAAATAGAAAARPTSTQTEEEEGTPRAVETPPAWHPLLDPQRLARIHQLSDARARTVASMTQRRLSRLQLQPDTPIELVEQGIATTCADALIYWTLHARAQHFAVQACGGVLRTVRSRRHARPAAAGSGTESVVSVSGDLAVRVAPPPIT